MTSPADACRVKIAYLTEQLAANAAYLLGIRYPDDAPLEAYDCPACPDWHLATLRGGVAVPASSEVPKRQVSTP